ncbi:acyl-CoA thioesterase [Rhodovibrionaceae bacterium A322]
MSSSDKKTPISQPSETNSGAQGQLPEGQPALRSVPMPSDSNHNGDIFGGWVLAQMDIAGSVPVSEVAEGRFATVAVDAMRFHRPIFVGDLVSLYADVTRIGTTSVTVKVETWVRRRGSREILKVTEGIFVYVTIDDDGNPRPVPRRAGS